MNQPKSMGLKNTRVVDHNRNDRCAVTVRNFIEKMIIVRRCVGINVKEVCKQKNELNQPIISIIEYICQYNIFYYGYDIIIN